MNCTAVVGIDLSEVCVFFLHHFFSFLVVFFKCICLFFVFMFLLRFNSSFFLICFYLLHASGLCVLCYFLFHSLFFKYISLPLICAFLFLFFADKFMFVPFISSFIVSSFPFYVSDEGEKHDMGNTLKEVIKKEQSESDDSTNKG